MEKELNEIHQEIHGVRNSLNAMSLMFEARHQQNTQKQTELENKVCELQNKVAELLRRAK